ncbi:MAG: hypothetical protein LBR80_07585 [Deltaproteobacteria bacterium]|jgi:hypothetical protein|nr:hypothetical protein [Deltaproteobacteria bacterium]
MTTELTRSFNTIGICKPLEHYMIPAIPRVPDINKMIDNKYFFVLHAPRQSGKTTCLTALTDKINSEGKYYALNCSLATMRNTRDDEKAMALVVSHINAGLRSSKVVELRRLAYIFNSSPYMTDPGTKVRFLLNDLCQALDRELVVFFDEADCLHEDPLVMFLGQIRDGYLYRTGDPAAWFPRAMALVGMRDIKDYLSRVRPEAESTGYASPFNVKSKSLSLDDFTWEEIGDLYGQHTAETGQPFEPEAVERAWHWTEGQPWLVNALAKDIIVERFRNDYSRPITGADVDLAAYDMLLRGETHFASLMERLKEPRVRKVIDPVIAGDASLPEGVTAEDIGYVIDLGLLKTDSDITVSLRPSNPIYGELIADAISWDIKKRVPLHLAGRWMDGTRLDMDGLLRAFQVYWSENSEFNEKPKSKDGSPPSPIGGKIGWSLDDTALLDKHDIPPEILQIIRAHLTGFGRESFPHIVLFAFLQRVTNGGAKVHRNYALGRSMVDICAIYKDVRYPVELKIKGVQALEKSLEQLSGYMDKCQSLAGWLVVFDKDSEKPWSEKITWDTVDLGDKTIRLVGC